MGLLLLCRLFLTFLNVKSHHLCTCLDQFCFQDRKNLEHTSERNSWMPKPGYTRASRTKCHKLGVLKPKFIFSLCLSQKPEITVWTEVVAGRLWGKTVSCLPPLLVIGCYSPQPSLDCSCVLSLLQVPLCHPMAFSECSSNLFVITLDLISTLSQYHTSFNYICKDPSFHEITLWGFE